MTIVVMIAARKTKPPKTPRAMIPPKNYDMKLLSNINFTNYKKDKTFVNDKLKLTKQCV